MRSGSSSTSAGSPAQRQRRDGRAERPAGVVPFATAMASRQGEKEQRRIEREQAEAAERAAAARRNRLRAVLGGLLGLLILAGAAYGISQAVGGDDGGGGNGGKKDLGDAAKVTLPEQQTDDVEEAAKAAGCTLEHAKYEGAGHAEK